MPDSSNIEEEDEQSHPIGREADDEHEDEVTITTVDKTTNDKDKDEYPNMKSKRYTFGEDIGDVTDDEFITHEILESKGNPDFLYNKEIEITSIDVDKDDHLPVMGEPSSTTDKR